MPTNGKRELGDPVIVVIIDARSAAVDRCENGRLTRVRTVAAAPISGKTDHMGDAARVNYHPGTRGKTATEAAAVARRAARDRLVAETLPHAIAAAGPDGMIVIGGAMSLAESFHGALPGAVAERSIVLRDINATLTGLEIATRAIEAAHELHSASMLRLVRSLLEHTGAHTTGVVGIVAVLDRIQQGAARRLFVTRRFEEQHPREAAELIAQAKTHRGTVEHLDGEAAERLDRYGGGVGATLRFAAFGAH